MAYRPRIGITTATPSTLADDPDVLRLLVERVVPVVLERGRSPTARPSLVLWPIVNPSGSRLGRTLTGVRCPRDAR